MAITVEQFLLNQCEKNYMFADQAQEVVNLLKLTEPMQNMKERWADDIEGYPQPLLTGLWLQCCTIALQWIDENCPDAWFRGAFSD
jgi:hypothetical protein